MGPSTASSATFKTSTETFPSMAGTITYTATDGSIIEPFDENANDTYYSSSSLPEYRGNI